MFAGEGSLHEDPLDKYWRLEQERKPPNTAPSLTTVIQVLPELNRPWQDHVVEPMPSMLTYTTGQVWYVKLPGAGSLSEVTISDVTPKTVELATRFNGKSRYIRTEVEFVEMKNA